MKEKGFKEGRSHLSFDETFAKTKKINIIEINFKHPFLTLQMAIPKAVLVLAGSLSPPTFAHLRMFGLKLFSFSLIYLQKLQGIICEQRANSIVFEAF